MRNTQRHLILAATLIVASAPAFGRDTGRVSVFVHEPGHTAPLPCRAWLDAGNERFFTPVTDSCTPYARDRSFSCAGRFVMEAPAGNAVLHVERGKEYFSVDRKIVVRADATVEVDVVLRRWVQMVEEGWYSADQHCHFGVRDLPVLKQIALADDVNLEPILTVWNYEREQSSDRAWPDWPHGPNVYADATHLVTLRNEEIERIGGRPFESTGALSMFGLKVPVKLPPGDSRYPCDAVLARTAKRVTPECVIDTDKPIWGENVVGVALGLFDSVQVCHNHYHRNSTLHMGWGMTAAQEHERRDWGEDELFHRTNQTYYRFLNCGFQLAVTGGSAMGVMAVPLGFNRTYAKLDGPLTEANYLAAIRAGRTFATTGPMLTLTAGVNEVGDKIAYSTQHEAPIGVEAHLRSIQPIDKLELVYNGRVVRSMNLDDRRPDPLLTERLTLALVPTRSGWIAARALFTAPDGRLRQAHTSPIYITVDGKPTASKEDAEYMMRWIDRLVAVAEQPGRYETTEQRADVLAVFQEARCVYEDIARQAEAAWPDDS